MSPHAVIRAAVRLPFAFSLALLAATLLPHQYNPLVEDGRDVQVLDRDNKVSWSATMAIWPCKGRDFVTHIRRATLDDGSVAIVNSATKHPEVIYQACLCSRKSALSCFKIWR